MTLDTPTLSSPSIEVVPYNNHWPDLFEQEATHIRQALGENCITVHHVGSTSVPGLAAKPIIDMLPVVKDILKVDAAALEKLGYTARGEFGMLFRRFFYKGEEIRTHHVHIWEEDHPEILKHLLFRNYLIQNPPEARRYEALKLQLVDMYRMDRNAYTLAKVDLISEMLQNAGFDGLLMVQALTPHEWAGVKTLRHHYFSTVLKKSNFDDQILEGDGQYHIVLMRGVDVIGYAHIKLENDASAILEVMATMPTHRTPELEQYFLSQLERWVTHQGVKSLLRDKR